MNNGLIFPPEEKLVEPNQREGKYLVIELRGIDTLEAI